MNVLHIDFETRSRIELKKYGIYQYSVHPSTSILCIGYAINDKKVKCFSTNYGTHINLNKLSDLIEAVNDKTFTFEAHNATFEMYMWNNILHKRMGLPAIPLEKWHCTAARAASLSLPRSLGDCAKTLKLKHQKDESGKYTMYRFMKPNTKGEWYEDKDDFKKLVAYCKKDVEVERDISNKIGRLSKSERQLWIIDQQINARGIRVDKKFVDIAIENKNITVDELVKECRKITDGLAPSQTIKLKQWINSQGLELEDIQSTTLDECLMGELPDNVRRVIEIRRSASNTSVSKYEVMKRMSDDNDVIRDQFLYHGANTGRWSGKNVQFQNLPRGLIKPKHINIALDCLHDKDFWSMRNVLFLEPMDVLKSCIRAAIIPRGKHILNVGDYSQIEARVIAWISNEQRVLDDFIAGKDLYISTASQIYQKKYEKVTEEERFIGKTASLALGFGGGKGAFISMAFNFRVKVEEELAEDIKVKWRLRNPNIVKFWYALEKAAIDAVKFGQITKCGCISFRVKNGFLWMLLPSGRTLAYCQPKVEMRETDWGVKQTLSFIGSDSQRGVKWGKVYTYGGKLAENATQAIARDVLCNGLVNVVQAGFKPIILVHDEIVSEDLKDFKSLEYMFELMCDIPKWAKGLPVSADGWRGYRYRK